MQIDVKSYYPTFYLNLVGYKGYFASIFLIFGIKFYLNLVGYKVDIIHDEGIFILFYLNLVGYKVFDSSAGVTLGATFYLNLVGYKDIT